MKICIIGTGYVGLVTGACFAEFGMQVVCVDKDRKKISLLLKNKIPYYEPGLSDLVTKNIKEERLDFSSDLKKSVQYSDVVFIAVGTPEGKDGQTDMSFVDLSAKEVAQSINKYTVIVNKSTVPVGSAKRVIEIVRKYAKKSVKYDVVSNPEFLREGSAIYDFMHPDRIVIGSDSRRATDIMLELYRPISLIERPIIVTNIETAEMIKYASNAFLATKISYINDIANLCELVGANVKDVAKAMGLDPRINPRFLHAGPGFGGSCFPKDTKALIHFAREKKYSLKIIEAVVELNIRHRELMVEKIKIALKGKLKGKVIGVLGLSFKPDTDDIRESPAIDIISMLIKEGAKVKTYDPCAMGNAKKIIKGIEFSKDAYSAAKNVDCLVFATEWNQFRGLDIKRLKKLMKSPSIIVDLRNIYNRDEIEKEGIKYYGVGV